MDVRLLIVVYLMICIISVVPSPYRSRSRNKNSQPTYDQKQTGEYNIQLHLKDFEVVAVLADSAFSEVGDYDYSYDYSELTVKPSPGAISTTTTTTKRPTTSKPLSTIASTVLPTAEPHQSTPAQPPTKTTIQPTQTTKAETPIETKSTEKSILSSTTEKITNIQIISTAPNAESEINSASENMEKQSTVMSEIYIKPVENVAVVVEKDKEQPNPEESMPLVVHRKCASGFTRDKLGRCRRVRRPPPQFSFGISRLATLASKLRQGTNDSQTVENSTEE